MIAQAAVGAAVSYELAVRVLGHQAPIFAPISALIVLLAARGQQWRRALEVTLGVTLGVTVADVLVLALGTGTLQIMLISALALSAALLLGAGPVLVTQAGISSVLVATVESPASGLVPARLSDALIGGAVALLLSQLLWPLNPLALIRRQSRPVFDELGAALDETADALVAGDPDAARRALTRARGIDAGVRAFNDALQVGFETVRLAPPRRRARDHLDIYAQAASQIDLAVRNTRVLARVAVSAVHDHTPAPSQLSDAVERLADAVRSLGGQLEDTAGDARTRELALEAVRLATSVVEHPEELALSSVVAQVRLAAADVLRGSGLNLGQAQEALDQAAGLEPPEGG